MLYSVHDDRNGGFSYYKAPGPAINADFQTPSFEQASPLGVPSVLASRPLPGGARPAGHGTMPKGSIARRGGGLAWRAKMAVSQGVDPSGLGIDLGVDAPVAKTGLAIAAGVVAFLLARRMKLPLPAQAVLATGAGALVYGIKPIEAAIVGVLPP